MIIAPSQIGHRFLHDCVGALLHHLEKGPEFHIDQLIIYLVWKWHSKNTTGFRCGQLSPAFSDWEFRSDSLVWHAKGVRKRTFGDLLQR